VEEELSKIALFTYRRLAHVKEVVESLLENPEAGRSDLVVYSDGPGQNAEDDVRSVRSYLRTIAGFRSIEIVERPRNLGLSGNIISGVNSELSRADRVIVVEDDIRVAPCFLRYMNRALSLYRDDPRVASIHGYNYPVGRLPFKTFFLRGADCWGWATWARAWRYFERDGQKLLELLLARNVASRFDFDGAYPYTQMLRDQINAKNDSWAVRWYASAFLNNLYTLYPSASLVENIGQDGTGEHCADVGATIRSNLPDRIEFGRRNVRESALARRKIAAYFSGRRSLARKVFGRLRRVIERVIPRNTPLARYGWFGDYESWEQAVGVGAGYAAENIADKVLASTLAVKEGRAAFERDSILFDEIEYSWPVIATLLLSASRAGGRLSVLDVGGALGSHYFQNRQLLSAVKSFRWTVVEQERFVRLGKAKIEDECLAFCETIEEAKARYGPNVALMSCVLPYVRDPLALLATIRDTGVQTIILDRTFFAERARLTVQKVPPDIYPAEYPCWFLTQESIRAVLQGMYELLSVFDARDGEICAGVRSRGMIWQARC
jgi:putative methyltransferase (TIGR04325 family)